MVNESFLTCTMVSSRSSTMRLVSVAKFPLITASWSNSALVLTKGDESYMDIRSEEEKGLNTNRHRQTKNEIL